MQEQEPISLGSRFRAPRRGPGMTEKGNLLPHTPRLNRAGVQAFVDLGLNDFVNGAVSGHPVHAIKGIRHNADAQVRFPFPVMAVMPGMHIEIIDVFEFNDAGKVVSMRAYWGPDNTIT